MIHPTHGRRALLVASLLLLATLGMLVWVGVSTRPGPVVRMARGTRVRLVGVTVGKSHTPPLAGCLLEHALRAAWPKYRPPWVNGAPYFLSPGMPPSTLIWLEIRGSGLAPDAPDPNTGSPSLPGDHPQAALIEDEFGYNEVSFAALCGRSKNGWLLVACPLFSVRTRSRTLQIQGVEIVGNWSPTFRMRRLPATITIPNPGYRATPPWHQTQLPALAVTRGIEGHLVSFTFQEIAPFAGADSRSMCYTRIVVDVWLGRGYRADRGHMTSFSVSDAAGNTLGQSWDPNEMRVNRRGGFTGSLTQFGRGYCGESAYRVRVTLEQRKGAKTGKSSADPQQPAVLEWYAAPTRITARSVP